MKYRGTTILILITLVMVLIAVYFGSGMYTIAATEPHWKITKGILEIIRDRSIVFHSNGIEYASDFDTAEILAKGIHHYHGMCRLCHGAPGYRRNEFASGLYPIPSTAQ